jgi:Tol biopolymer transport system component
MNRSNRILDRRFGHGVVVPTGFAMLFVAAILLAACTPATTVQPTESSTVQPATIVTPAPTMAETPEAEVTSAIMQPTLGETRPPPEGLVYRNEEGLWQVDSDGQSRLLTNHADAVPSPDLALAYLWNLEDSSLILIDLKTGQEKFVLSEPNLNGLFTWADNQTILLGLYLSPEEADWPSFGHLASLDVDGETATILDSEWLMSSSPALLPDGRTIAYSSDGPYLYSADDGVQPFPAETFTGLSGVSGHFSPAWSPDGRYLAWIVSGGPFGDDPDLTMGLAIYDLEAGTATLRLAFDPARWGATPPAALWSPDGQWLALRVFANGEEGSGLWLLDIDGVEENYIPGVSGNANYPVWSPDGRQLIYFDYADEDEPPYSSLLLFDLDSDLSYPVDLASGLGLLWLEPGFGDEPTVEDPLCRQVPRPALLLIDRGDYFIANPTSAEACQFDFPGELSGLIQSGGEALFYHELDATTQTAVVKRLGSDGTDASLSFTETGLPAQFLHFVVSPDGRQVAWSASRLDESGQAVSDLWLAGTDGSGLSQLLGGIPGTDNRFVIPIRFSPDGQTLYYAMQPIGVGGSWVAFSGRYDSLHVLPTSGGQPVELFRCPDGSLLCLGDFTGEAEALRLAYTDSAEKAIYVATAGGEVVGQFSFPEADFLGYPTFGPGGELAFYVAAIGEHADGYPIPQPGAIYLVRPPYDGEPQLVKSDDTVATLLGWLDSEHLVYNSIDPGGNWGAVVTSLSGEAMIWGPGPTQFITILRE